MRFSNCWFIALLKNFLHGVNDGLGYSMKGNSMGQRYSESICNLITQENSKGIKSFRLF